MMFTATRCAFAVWLSAPLIAASLPAQTPVLADSDVVVAGIAASKPRKVVEDVLGSPDSISGTEWFPDLHYPGLTVSFTESGRVVSSITLVTPQYQTARGLRVGDSLARARRLYGLPDVIAGRYYYCGTASAYDDGIRLAVVGARIASIEVGVLCRRD